jgi:hypothetical protein
MFWGTSRFYLAIITYLCTLLSCNFIIQDLKNRNRRLNAIKQELLINVSNKEAQISEFIIETMNTNKGKSIQPSQLKNNKNR